MLKETLIVLTSNEKALIIAIRDHFKYGEVIITVRDGVPQFIKRAFESKDLTGHSNKD